VVKTEGIQTMKQSISSDCSWASSCRSVA